MFQTGENARGRSSRQLHLAKTQVFFPCMALYVSQSTFGKSNSIWGVHFSCGAPRLFKNSSALIQECLGGVPCKLCVFSNGLGCVKFI